MRVLFKAYQELLGLIKSNQACGGFLNISLMERDPSK